MRLIIQSLQPHLDGDFGVFVGQLQGIMEDFEVFLQSESGCRQLLLVRLNVLSQLGRRVDELEPLAALQARQQPLVVLGVLPHPGVAVVHVNSRNILIGKTRKDYKPLGKEVSLEAIAGPYVGQVYYNLIGLGVVGFEREENMVDEQVTVDLSGFEPKEEKKKLSFQVLSWFVRSV